MSYTVFGITQNDSGVLQLRGLRGEKGDKGPKGDKGETGPKGDPGSGEGSQISDIRFEQTADQFNLIFVRSDGREFNVGPVHLPMPDISNAIPKPETRND